MPFLASFCQTDITAQTSPIKYIIYRRLNITVFITGLLCCILSSCNTTIVVINNTYEKVTINKTDFAQTNFCTMQINYPSLYGLKDLKLQNKINTQLKEHFLADVDNYCFENNFENIRVDIEKTYNFFISNNLLSVISNELVSSNIIAGNVIYDYNIDLKTGMFLTANDLFNQEYKDEIVKIVLDNIFQFNSENFHDENLYEYYCSIKEEIFNKFHIQVLERTIVFMFKGLGNNEPIYKSEILKKEIKKYINKKYGIAK